MFISVAFLIAHSLSIRKSARNAFDGYSVWNETKIVYINIIQELSKLSRKCHTAFIRSSFLTSKETFSLYFPYPVGGTDTKIFKFFYREENRKGHTLSLSQCGWSGFAERVLSSQPHDWIMLSITSVFYMCGGVLCSIHKRPFNLCKSFYAMIC